MEKLKATFLSLAHTNTQRTQLLYSLQHFYFVNSQGGAHYCYKPFRLMNFGNVFDKTML